ALVLFALQRYTEAAATIHPVLDVGPGWDWKTLSGLYPSVDTYTSQLRALEAACKQNPKADMEFLLGYHYITCGHPDSALLMFQRTRERQPKDKVAGTLASTLSPRDAQASAPPPAVGEAIPADTLVGDWKATGRGSSNYSMSLGKDGSFTWS